MGFAIQYSVYGLVTIAPRELTGARFMGWLQSWGEPIYFPALIALPYLLFPNGQLPSPRWRPAIGIIALAIVLGTLNQMIDYGPIYVYARSPAVQLPMWNPTGMLLPPWIKDFLGMGYFVGLAVVLISIFAPIARYRKACDTQRHQLKWSIYFTIISLLLMGTVGEMIGQLGLGLILLILLAAAAIAIVLYRPYDINLIINRTLVYGLITLIFALTYLTCITILHSTFSRLAGGQSSAAIAASTLFIAALFRPLRRRVQLLFDRRFYRSKYDMQQILAAFGASLRDGVDQEAISESLLNVIRETIQPQHLSLWLRDSHHSPWCVWKR